MELPGIEPGSSVTLPGLLRAQFARNLYSALWIGRTRPDDGPSWRYEVPPNPVNTAGLPGQGQTWADRHAVAVLGSEGVVALSILGAYEFATTLTVVSSLHRHASPDSMYEVETISAPCILHAGSRARTAWKDFPLYYTLGQEG